MYLIKAPPPKADMKTTLNIKGMHCKSCEMLIADALQEEGITVADISHKTGKATVSFDAGKTSQERIKDIIKKEGYSV